MTDLDRTERALPWLDQRTRWALAAAVVVAVALAATASNSILTALDAVILGAVEGITEFLPISSTGHLLVTERLLDLGNGTTKTATDTYTVAIQLGAILAVVAIYRTHIAAMTRGLLGRDRDGLRLVQLLAIAFVPAAVVGLALDNTIKAHLFGMWPVITAWTVGGVFLLLWKPGTGSTGLGQITYRHAAIIGSAQVLALWPGTSRSLVTIAAALAIGLTATAAVEFSFLLGLITLTAATALDLAKHGPDLIDQFGLATPTLGALVAAITATLAVAWFVDYLRTRSLALFGWYRLAAAATGVALLATGRI